jgi:hypothetical protein
MPQRAPLGANQVVLVGHQACLGYGGVSHMRSDGVWSALNTHCTIRCSGIRQGQRGRRRPRAVVGDKATTASAPTSVAAYLKRVSLRVVDVKPANPVRNLVKNIKEGH